MLFFFRNEIEFYSMNLESSLTIVNVSVDTPLSELAYEGQQSYIGLPLLPMYIRKGHF
jgi:hypothetical protein